MTAQATAHRAAQRQLKAAVEGPVQTRSGGICEVDGEQHATQGHHRDPRGMGGSSRHPRYWDPNNLLAVCDTCHRLIETNRTWALDLGYLVHRSDDYTLKPVLLHGQRLVLLTGDTYTEEPMGDNATRLYRELYDSVRRRAA